MTPSRRSVLAVGASAMAAPVCIRVSPSFVNTPGDMDALVAALKEIAA